MGRDMRKSFKYVLFFFILMMCLTNLRSQQLPIYSQYWMNKFLLNPAVAGHEGYTSVNLTIREQWVGLPGAPSTYAISAQTRLLKNSFISRNRSVKKRSRSMSRSGKVGYGGYVFSDNNGIFSRLGVQGTYAYHLSMRRSQLSFGGSLTSYQHRIDKTKIRTQEDAGGNASIIEAADNVFVIDANFGVYYSDRSVYAGFSTLNLFESFAKISSKEDGPEFRMERNYLLMGGYRYDIIDFFFIEPFTLFKLSEVGIAQWDIGMNGYFKQDYWLGVAYRTGSTSRIAQETIKGRGAAVMVYGGARVDKYFFGYSFDYTFASISSRTLGSHEIMLAIRFGDGARRYRWLNRY